MVKVYEQGNLSKHMDSMKVRERERESRERSKVVTDNVDVFCCLI